MTLGCEVAGYRQNAGVVVTDLEAAGQDRGIGVVEFHAQRPAAVQGYGLVEASSRDPQVVEQAQRSAREAAEFGGVRLPSEFRDDHSRQHHFVLVETQDRVGI